MKKTLTKLNQWPSVNATVSGIRLLPPYAPQTELMNIRYAYFLSKDPNLCSISHRVDHAATYMNESNLPNFNKIYIDIVRAFIKF